MVWRLTLKRTNVIPMTFYFPLDNFLLTCIDLLNFLNLRFFSLTQESFITVFL